MVTNSVDRRPFPVPAALILTRRTVLARLGGAGLGALAATPALRALGQDAIPATDDLPPVVAEYIAAFEAGDIDRVIATLDEDVIFEEVPTGTILTGRDAIRTHYQTFFTAVSDIAIQYTSAFASGDQAAGEWMFRGRYIGQIPELPRGTGQALVLRGADFIEVAGDRIHRYREYYDFYAFLVQLGALPAGLK